MTEQKEKIKSLYERFVRGEQEAVVELVAEYRMGLIAFIRGYVKDISIAEELASDVFAELLVKAPKLKDGAAFKTYLFSMAKNRALTYLRKNKRLVSLSGEEKTSKWDDPEWVLLWNDAQRGVLGAIEGLHNDYRDVLFLRYYEDLALEEIAKVMKKNKKQVYNLLERAKKALKKVLKEEGYSYEDD